LRSELPSILPIEPNGTAFVALLIVFSLFRSVPEKRIDWSTGILQLVLGGAVGFALKRSP
jgi:hypothetical protein